MKVKEYREEYYKFSAKAGDVARQLAFAGIAVVWVFKAGGPGGSLTLPRDLLLPTTLFVASLAFDLLHYMWSTFIWGAFSHLKKVLWGKADEDELGDPPFYFNWPALLFFWLKLIAVLVGYLSLFDYVRTQLGWA